MHRGQTSPQVLPADHLYTGEIRKYFEQEDQQTGETKQFGFITCEEIPSRRGNIYYGLRMQRKVDFRGIAPRLTMLGHSELRIPKLNEPVVFILSETTRGLRAQPWAFLDVYDKALESIPSFRIMSNITGLALWEGGITAKNRPKELLNILKYYDNHQVTWQRFWNGDWVICENPIKSVGQRALA